MAMLAVKIKPELARTLTFLQVPGTPESPEDFHITMFYFEEEPNINEVADLIVPLFDALQDAHPISCHVEEVSHFSASPEGKYPIVLPVISPQLIKLRENIALTFDQIGIEYSKKWPEYKPHITLAYSEEPTQYMFEGFSFQVDEISYYGGDQHEEKLFIVIPLK